MKRSWKSKPASSCDDVSIVCAKEQGQQTRFSVNVTPHFLKKEVMAETTTSWNTTIILSTALKNHTISRMLMAQQHRIRFSETVEKGALIFPLSGNAFLLVDLQNHLEPFEESELIKRIDIFIQVHRNSFLLFYLPFSGERGLQILSDIQCRFFHTKVRILPVRNNNEVLNGMLTIAKATSKSHMDSICFRMSLAQAHIVESSGVWEFLKGTLSW